MKHRRLLVALPCLVGLVAATTPASAEPPAGQSALLNGMHDIESAAFLEMATSGCDKGWVTDLRYIGSSGVPSADCHAAEIAAGISVIQRLDVDGAQSFPLDPAGAPGYSDAFASYASQCPDIHVWIVGNEPNFTANDSDPAKYASPYAEAYTQVRSKLHAVPGHGSDLVLVAPASPYSPYCICSMHKILQEIHARGGAADGFALHAYTQVQFPGEYGGLAGFVTSEAMSGSNDFCGYPFHWQFRIYKDFIGAAAGEGEGDKPVFLTETGNACAPQAGNPCYPDADVGYFHAMLAEVAAYNADPQSTTKIRAVTPYRWTPNDDGTGRDFAIGDRPLLFQELKGAFAQKLSWTSPKGCSGEVACQDDGDCAEKTICDLESGKCAPTASCAPKGVCPAGEVCRDGTFDCVPASRGAAGVVFDPAAPDPMAPVKVDVSADVGYTNVGLGLERIGGPDVTTALDQITGSGPYHWIYDATLVGTGTYRATFRADPAANTVYAIGYVNAGDLSFPDGGGGAGGSVTGGTGGAGGGVAGGGAGGSGASGGGDAPVTRACDCGIPGDPRGPWGEMLALVLGATAVLRRRRIRG